MYVFFIDLKPRRVEHPALQHRLCNGQEINVRQRLTKTILTGFGAGVIQSLRCSGYVCVDFMGKGGIERGSYCTRYELPGFRV